MGPLRQFAVVVVVRAKARGEMADRGVPVRERIPLAREIDEDLISTASMMAAAKLGVSEAKAIADAKAIGDGSFFEWFEKFLNSEFGKMLMDFLMKLLLGLI